MTRTTPLILFLVALAFACSGESASLKFVGPTAAGTGAGTSWANRAKGDSAWFRTVSAGDTVLFYPGFYDSLVIVPPNRTPGVFTYYWAGDGTSNQKYDPGVASLGETYTRDQFNQSLLVAKLCTLTSSIVIPSGSSWTNYSGSVYYRNVSVPRWAAYTGNAASNCIQDTTRLDIQLSVGGVSSAGRHYYDMSAGRLYVWTTDGSNPSDHTFYITKRPIVDLAMGGANGNCQFYGFDFRGAAYSLIHLGGGDGGRDSVWVDHCRGTKVSAETGSNEGFFGCQLITTVEECSGVQDSTCTYATDGKGSRMRACYGSDYGEPNNEIWRSRMITSYNQSHFVVESCYAVGPIGGLCDWKNNTAPLTGISYGNVARFNTVKYWDYCAIENLTGLCWYDSTYGNIFIGDPTNNNMKGMWFEWSDFSGNQSYGNHHFVANNTFYQCEIAIASSVYENDHDAHSNWIKYNIFYGGGQAHNSQFHYRYSNDTNFVSDSNLYYNLPTSHFNRNGTNMSLSAWQGYQSGVWSGSVYHDIHSVTYNPNFVSAGSDFRRTGVTQEMDLTYGGTRFQWFGAEQPAVNPPLSLVSFVADSFRCDYSGENDSVRVRFQLPAQSWPDSVVISISLVSTIDPTPTQTSNRLAVVFKGSSALDTAFLSLSVSESDTLIIGGWVSDPDSGYSDVKFDTLILTGPVVPTGACCMSNGTCETLSSTACTSSAGTYQGNGTSCSPSPCNPVITERGKRVKGWKRPH